MLDTSPLALGLGLAAAFTAGLVRGFSGFGAALVMMPALSAIHGPLLAVPALNMLDFLLSLPLLPKAVKSCDWRELIPLTIPAWLMVPLGVMALVTFDPELARTFVALIALGVAMLLATGYRYQGPTPKLATITIGAISGTLSGFCGLAGPPVVLFWLGRRGGSQTIRANMIVFFALLTLSSATVMAWQGLFNLATIKLVMIHALPYGIGLFFGIRLFSHASERLYRHVAVAIVTGVSVSALILA